MSFTFRPAKRENTPLIIGLAGPTKSGKTYSAHRIAAGLAHGGTIAMINAEGAKGHQYSDKFSYVATDITAPYRPERYTEALKAALELNPAVVIIDSLSHMHDGPGGVLDYHEEELDRLAGQDMKARQRSTWSAWVKPKAAENEFIYTMLSADCHLILCFRAKEKIRIVKGKDPEDLGWQPIAGERVAFETIFTLTLPPHSKGVPDLAISDMREPFDTLIPKAQALSEQTGEALAKWAAGGASNGLATAKQRRQIFEAAKAKGIPEQDLKAILGGLNAGSDSTRDLPAELVPRVLAAIASQSSGGPVTQPVTAEDDQHEVAPATPDGSAGEPWGEPQAAGSDQGTDAVAEPSPADGEQSTFEGMLPPDVKAGRSRRKGTAD